MIKGTQNHSKSQFLQFSCFVKKIKRKKVFFSKTSRRRLCYHQAEGVGRSERSPERLLDEKGGFEDQLSYPKLKFGGRKVSFRCLLKSNGLKTCSYGSATCFAAIPHIPNPIFSIQVNQNSSKIDRKAKTNTRQQVTATIKSVLV